MIHRSLKLITNFGRNFGTKAMDISNVVSALNRLAPVSLAEQWDNVGLLIEPSPPHVVTKILLTNDLTEEVMQECLDERANFILSYHPPIFQSLKRLTSANWKDRLVIKALENRVAVYSPHTSCDAVQNGVNDWLASGLGDILQSKPIHSSSFEPNQNKVVRLCVDMSDVRSNQLCAAIESTFVSNLETTKSTVQPGKGKSFYDLKCSNREVEKLSQLCQKYKETMSELQILSADKMPMPNTGMGRICSLVQSTSIMDLVENIKRHLKLRHVRLALGRNRHTSSLVQTVALCAGSGGSVLKGVMADLYLTGEMSHHDVLDAVSNGISVVLCEHSNTERGYLSLFRDLLETELDEPDLKIVVSSLDKDPLNVY